MGAPAKAMQRLKLTGQGAAAAHRTQYFEMFGNRALYKGGWMGSARHSIPWQLTGRNVGRSNLFWRRVDGVSVANSGSSTDDQP